MFNEEDLRDYDTNLKVNPPLRRMEDMLAVKNAIINGEAAAIASHHIPQNYDNKVCEFEYAKNGMIGLETLFGTVGKYLPTDEGDNKEWTIEKLISLLTVSPRKIFHLPVPEITVGSIASLTLFNPATEYIFEENMIASKCRNTPFVGKQLKGKIIGIINGNKTYFN